MTFTKRAISLFTTALIAATLIACAGGPADISTEFEGCPDGYRHLELDANIIDGNGEPIGGRTFTVVFFAQSVDPEFQGTIIQGVGVAGRNPYVTQGETDGWYEANDENGWSPVICHPADRAVAMMVRVSFQHPTAAYQRIECQLTDTGIAGIQHPGQTNPTALGRVSLDQRRVELSDLMPGEDPDRWYVAQCDYLYVPEGFSGQIPELFPRPGDE
jgi:hypothetical protein